MCRPICGIFIMKAPVIFRRELIIQKPRPTSDHDPVQWSSDDPDTQHPQWALWAGQSRWGQIGEDGPALGNHSAMIWYISRLRNFYDTLGLFLFGHTTRFIMFLAASISSLQSAAWFSKLRKLRIIMIMLEPHPAWRKETPLGTTVSVKQQLGRLGTYAQYNNSFKPSKPLQSYTTERQKQSFHSSVV